VVSAADPLQSYEPNAKNTNDTNRLYIKWAGTVVSNIRNSNVHLL
jgi:hypothetical protein